MVGIFSNFRKGLDWITDLNEKYGGTINAITGLPVQQFLGKALPAVSKVADIGYNTYQDYQSNPEGFSLGGWLKGMSNGKYTKSAAKRSPKKPVVYKRPEDLHPRIELSDDTTLALPKPKSYVEELGEID
jgi:hypothetical protein